MIKKRVIYAIVTISILLLTYYFIPPIYQGDAGSAPYLLNTIAAALSTIFTICLSLIMVAIQLSAGKYSPRIFNFFLQFPLNVPLVLIFVTAILHSSFILAHIKVFKDNTTTLFMSKAISFDVILMAYSFLILLIYIFEIIELLKPENLILRLRDEIVERLTRDDVHNAVMHLERISDVAKKTTQDMDTFTSVSCIRTISSVKVRDYLKDNKKSHWYIQHVITNFHGIAIVALNHKLNAVAEAVVDELSTLAETAISNGEYFLVEQIIETLSIIVSANLVGHHQLMVIQTIISRMEHIALTTLPFVEKDEKAKNLEIKIFKTLNFLGKQIIDSEVIGVTFAAKYIITTGMGTILSVIGEKGLGLKTHDYFFEYVDLAVRLVKKGETKNIITFTTWMRTQLLNNNVPKGKQILLLKIYLVVSAVAVYLKQHDKASLILKALGKYYNPDLSLIQQLEKDNTIIRHFFDYHNPHRFLYEVYYIWVVYYDTCKENKLIPKKFSASDVYQNIETWSSLFEGLRLDEVIFEDEIPQELGDTVITQENMPEKDSELS